MLGVPRVRSILGIARVRSIRKVTVYDRSGNDKSAKSFTVLIFSWKIGRYWRVKFLYMCQWIKIQIFIVFIIRFITSKNI